MTDNHSPYVAHLNRHNNDNTSNPSDIVKAINEKNMPKIRKPPQQNINIEENTLPFFLIATVKTGSKAIIHLIVKNGGNIRLAINTSNTEDAFLAFYKYAIQYINSMDKIR